ncbi:MAG: exo-alpha-sialidase, partial [Chloroflexi bacterium]|nr:exo-alpha-sialidase [Chloroflexota bacterium]
LLIGACLIAVALASARDAAPSAAAPPVTFNCSLDATCPAIAVAGDPFATIGPGPAPFRGYGDPELEYDPSTGTLWLTYSWLDVLITDPGPPPLLDLGVRTHLARSDDNGATWTFVGSLNETTPITHPGSGAEGWTIHEVSALLREPSGGWQALWLTYFDPLGEAGVEDRSDFYYAQTIAAAPEDLGSTVTPWIRGLGTSASFGAVHNLSLLPELTDCVAFTEPALFAHGGETYLSTNCAIVDESGRRDDLERLVLLREETVGYSYVGELLTYDDAVDLGATRIEQADIFYGRDGSVLLVATPIVTDGVPEHLGCVVFEITDIAAAEVGRDAAGNAVQLAWITADDPIFGPGACTYDPQSETGVLMHVHDYVEDPFDMEFTVRATGVHPSADNDGDGWTDVDETAIGTLPAAACAATETAGDEDPDAWPVDMDDNQFVNSFDLIPFIGKLNIVAPGPPYTARVDLTIDGKINTFDLIPYIGKLNEACLP